MQIFLTLVIAGAFGYGTYRLYRKQNLKQLVRWPLILVTGFLSLIFLMSAFTGNSTKSTTNNASTRSSVHAHIKRHKTHKKEAHKSSSSSDESSSISESQSIADSESQSTSESESISESQSNSISESQSNSISESQSVSASESSSVSVSQSITSSVAASISASQVAEQSRSAVKAAADAQSSQQTSTVDSTEGPVIGDSRSHIYHLPGQRTYHISPANAVTFNSEQDAINAGYRKSLR